MKQLAAQPQIEFVMKVLNGPDKGAIYKILSAHVKIGRGDDNDIVLKGDSRCSRYHASLSLSSKGVEIRDISDRNKVLVNGVETSHEILAPGSLIQLGDTKLQFGVGSGSELYPQAQGMSVAAPNLRKRSRTRLKKSGPSAFFYTILVLLGVLVYYLMTSKPNVGNEPKGLRTEQDVLNTIDKNRQLVQNLAEQKRQDGRESSQYLEAQANYVKGFRDFQKGQFERSLDYFSTCLSIYPQHTLCNQYYTEAKTRFSELVQYYLNLGYEYQRKNQFSQCKSAFNNVRVMQRDKTSTIFREADTGYAACDAREKERL